MFKSFASALLAASVVADTATNFGEKSVVRGKNDGSDNDNAAYCDMIASNGDGVKTDLFTYLKRENKVLEWHGETKMYLNGLAHAGAKQIFAFGFCMQMTEAKAAEGTNPAVEETYDCSSVVVKPVNSADGKKITQNTTVQFYSNEDWKYTGTRADFSWSKVNTGNTLELDQVKDASGNSVDSVADSSKNNFQISGGKSHTNCVIASNKISCARPASDADAATWMDSGITYHWFRNFSTADEAGFDIQLTEADGDKKRNMFSFVWAWFDEAKSDAAPNKEYLNAAGGADYGCAPITAAAYKTLVTDVEAAEKKAEEDAAAKKAEEEKNKNNTKTDDWATQTTAHATALLAAVYALAF